MSAAIPEQIMSAQYIASLPRYRLARMLTAVADVDARTTQRWLAGSPVAARCAERLASAAASLGIPLPARTGGGNDGAAPNV